MRSATWKACAMMWVMIDDADALVAHPLDHLEPAPRLLDAERREGLVEQHQLAAPMDEAVELDRLALAAGKMLDIDPERRDVGAGIGDRLGGGRLHLALLQDRNAEEAPGQISRPMKKLATTSTLVQSDRSW